MKPIQGTFATLDSRVGSVTEEQLLITFSSTSDNLGVGLLNQSQATTVSDDTNMSDLSGQPAATSEDDGMALDLVRDIDENIFLMIFLLGMLTNTLTIYMLNQHQIGSKFRYCYLFKSLIQQF